MKNSLYSHLGMTGLSIYHETLGAFLSDHNDSIEVDDEKDKVFSTYRDYYLMPKLLKLVDVLVTYKLKKNSFTSTQSTHTFNDTLEKPVSLDILDNLLVLVEKMDKHVSVVDRLKLANSVSNHIDELAQLDYTKEKYSYVYDQTVFLRKFIAEKALPFAEYSVKDFMEFLFDLIEDSVWS